MPDPVAADSINFRPATPADAPAIVDIEHRSFDNAHERFALRRVHHLTINPRVRVTVAEQHGVLLGWIAGFNWLRTSTPWGRIYAIAVDPASRGQKLGKRLMQHMMSILAANGAAKIFLEVRMDNHAAIGLYRKLGFADCRTIRDFYGPGISAQRMIYTTNTHPPKTS